MSKTMKQAIESANVKPAGGRAKTDSKAIEAMLASDAKLSFKEAIGNVLLRVPKSAQKMVTEGVNFLIRSVQTQAHNWYECGVYLSKIKNAIHPEDFVRLSGILKDRIDLTRDKITTWINNSDVLTAVIPTDEARDALLVVSGGRGLVDRGKDGNPATLNGAYTAALKKHPVPASGTSYEDCLDWAREVSIVVAKYNAASPTDNRYKACKGAFERLLNGTKGRFPLSANLKESVSLLVELYRMVDVKSQPCALAALEAFEDSSIAPAQAGTNAMALLAQAKQTETAVNAATVGARKASKTA